MEETIRLLFMCFLAAIHKINSSFQEGDSHSRKSKLFPISLGKGLYLKTLLQGVHCSGLHEHKTPLGEMLSYLPLLLSDGLCTSRKGDLGNEMACRSRPLKLASGNADVGLCVSPI